MDDIIKVENCLFERLSKAAQLRDFDQVTVLFTTLEDLLKAKDFVRSLKDSTENPSLNSNSSSGPQFHFIRREISKVKFKISIDWQKMGVNRSIEEIFDNVGSKALLRLIEKLHTVFGTPVLETLRSLKTSRGPLLSMNPKMDYRKGARKACYTFHRVGNTQHYLLTHTTTEEKIDIVHAIPQFLGFAKTAIRWD